VFDATVRNLELIGEAAGRIPADVRQNAGDIALATDHCHA
jgi:uncharacterized protein with HEPN domain